MNEQFLNSQVLLATSKGNHELVNGHPIFFLKSQKAIHLFEEPTLFINDEFVTSGYSRSIHTWSAAAQALKGWFEFLQELKIDWELANRETRLDYKHAYQQSISPQTGEKYQPETISNRMIIIRQFYKYAEIKGWYSGSLGADDVQNSRLVKVNTPIESDMLAHTRQAGGFLKHRDKDLPKRSKRDVIHPLTQHDLNRLHHYAGPMASQPGTDTRPSRNRLFIDLAIHTCARLNDLNSLKTLHFLNLHVSDEELFFDFPIHLIRKGGNKGLLTCPGWLVRDAQAYIDGERAEAIKAGNDNEKFATKNLFVSMSTSSRAGRPLTNRALEQQMQKICIEADIVEYKEIVNTETGELVVIKVAKHSPHDLRHTGIVLIYYTERLRGNTSPWKKCQLKAGHSKLQTTLDTYLTHVETWDSGGGNSLDIMKAIGIRR